nr:hypothetical protein [Tanacetum cinerariifolium]
MGIPNEHQLKFNFINYAKKLLKAVEKRFGRNATTIKTQRNLLKQQYENFTAPSLKMFNQTFDRLLEFFGELAHIDLISTEIKEADFNPEEEIRLVEKLLYDNSSPRPLEEFNSENFDVVIESCSPSPIPIEGSDSLMEEIDIFLLRMTRCHRILKMMTMTQKGISFFSKNLLTRIPFHFLKMSHFILMFHHPLVLLRNHQMMMEFTLMMSPLRDF